MAALIFLTYIAVILIVGIVCTLIAREINIPNILLLIIAGMVMGAIPYGGKPLIEFPGVFLTSIGILALVMIVFDSSSRFKIRDFDSASLKALKISVIFLFINAVLLTFATKLIFNIQSILLALVFSTLMAGTDPVSVLAMFGQTKNKILKLLEIESIVNTPLVVLIPFIILEFMGRIKTELLISKFIEQIGPFLQQFVVGIGSGVLIGIIVFKTMRKEYEEKISPLAVITAALLAYILAENLRGNGVLAVTSMGLLFGNMYLKQKIELKAFSSVFANSLEILVFVLVGLIIKIPFTFDFFMKSFLLFAIYILIRYLSIAFSFKNENFSFKEKLFMSLNVQKGVAVAVVAFTLISYEVQRTLLVEGVEKIVTTSFVTIPGALTILNLILAFMLYSLVLSTLVIKFLRWFIPVKTEK